MRRSQRIVHRMLWPVLAIGLGVALALGLRPAPAAVAQIEVMR